MKFQTHSHRHGDIILKEGGYSSQYQEVLDVISGISDQDILEKYGKEYLGHMSLSHVINDLLRERFVEKGWTKEAPIFQEEGFKSKKWRLDFAKGDISIEVGFNHGEAIAWNLIKPVLASERNNVKKAIQTKVGIVICVTKALKSAGGFDGAVGEFEKIKRYLEPLNTVLTVPMMLIGLEAPETFMMKKTKVNNRSVGEVVSLTIDGFTASATKVN
ncbi:MAG TPA: BglII/BstYI family type II restriction endonuclease [Candidatus Paceibacterota bacterium]|nr:BglII/BstYI family type II restriction endonuclease [Candidatus Paceibacterota bacterium]